QVLYPVNHFTQRGKAPPPLVTRDQLVDMQRIGGLQPALAQLLEFFGFRLIELFLYRAQDRIKRTHGLLDHMEAVDDVDLVAKDRLDGRKERLGHIQDDHCNSLAFVLRTAREPGHHLVSTSAFARGNRLAFVHVDDHRVVAVPLAPGVCINVNGSPKLSEAAPTAPFNRPAKHGALGEAVATGECSARAPLQAFLSYAGVETLGPLDLRAERLTCFPGPMPAICALEPPHMQPQHDGMLQDGYVADAAWSALLHASAARLAPGTHEVIVSAFKMHLQLLGAEHLTDDAKFW